MKKLLFLATILLSFHAFSQAETDCNDLNKLACCPSLEDGYRPEILPWEKVGSKTTHKEALYNMFPKILEYKEFIYRDLFSSSFQSLEEYAPQDPPTLTNSKLKFSYCIPKTRLTMKVEITDYSAPFFETKMGKAVKDLDLFVFQSGAVAFGVHSHSPSNKKYKNSVIASARFSPYGGQSDDVQYIAYVSDRYLITITIDDKPKRFAQPIQVEEFLNDYISQINLNEN